MLVWAPWLRSFLIKVMSDEVAPLRPAAMTYRRFFERELVLGYDNGLDASRWCGSLPDQPGTRQDCDALLVSSLRKVLINWLHDMALTLKLGAGPQNMSRSAETVCLVACR